MFSDLLLFLINTVFKYKNIDLTLLEEAEQIDESNVNIKFKII